MAQPSSALTRWDASLNTNEFDLEMNRRGFIGRRFSTALSATSRRPTARCRSRTLRSGTRHGVPLGYGRDTFEAGTRPITPRRVRLGCPLDDREKRVYRDLVGPRANEHDASLVDRVRSLRTRRCGRGFQYDHLDQFEA